MDTAAGLIGVQAVLTAREEFRGRVDVSVVAFPQDGVLRDPGTAELVEEAMNLGADVVGGIPWIEATPADQEAHVDWACALAARLGRRVAMLTDDAPDPAYDTTRMLAEAMRRHGLEGRGVACHARAVGHYDRRPADRRPRARPGRRTGARQRPAHRLGGAAGGACRRAGRGGRAGSGRHRGRLLPVRPAQPARGGVPGRAPAGHALGAAAGGARRPGHDVGRPRARTARLRPPRGRAGGPARARRHPDRRPARAPRPAAGGHPPVRCSTAPAWPAASCEWWGQGSFQSRKTSMWAPISTSRS